MFHQLLYYLSGLYLFFGRIAENWQYNTKKKDVVLDVGCRNRLLLRSNIVLDKYPDTERPTTGKLRKSKYQTLVIRDCLNLAFKNKSIDFIYSKYLVENIDIFSSELQRVGKQGGLISLSILNELFNSEPFHCWLKGKNNEMSCL